MGMFDVVTSPRPGYVAGSWIGRTVPAPASAGAGLPAFVTVPFGAVPGTFPYGVPYGVLRDRLPRG